ncbi:MAG: hypothetical protein ACN6NI_05685 [Acinetobacter sp.]
MKFITTLLSTLLLAGCMSGDLKKSEQLLQNFQCAKIEMAQMPHTSMTDYYQHSLYSSKSKAESYIEHYQQGDKLFDIPLSEVVQQQYDLYKDACQSLGGILASSENQS